MQRFPVDSSTLKSVGYDKESRILEVEFHENKVYHYFDVPIDVFNSLVDADSIGAFLNKRVKTRFAFKKVG
jgi:hypothetical protein